MENLIKSEYEAYFTLEKYIWDLKFHFDDKIGNFGTI